MSFKLSDLTREDLEKLITEQELKPALKFKNPLSPVVHTMKFWPVCNPTGDMLFSCSIKSSWGYLLKKQSGFSGIMQRQQNPEVLQPYFLLGTSLASFTVKNSRITNNPKRASPLNIRRHFILPAPSQAALG